MQISSKDLHRFRLDGPLGEGADLEVFAATDTQTGSSVVIKRPHPTLLERGQQRTVERRTAEAIAIKIVRRVDVLSATRNRSHMPTTSATA